MKLTIQTAVASTQAKVDRADNSVSKQEDKIEKLKAQLVEAKAKLSELKDQRKQVRADFKVAQRSKTSKVSTKAKAPVHAKVPAVRYDTLLDKVYAADYIDSKPRAETVLGVKLGKNFSDLGVGSDSENTCLYVGLEAVGGMPRPQLILASSDDAQDVLRAVGAKGKFVVYLDSGKDEGPMLGSAKKVGKPMSFANANEAASAFVRLASELTSSTEYKSFFVS